MIDQRDEEPRLHLFTVGDPRLWELRSRLSAEELALGDVTAEEWDAFHAVIPGRVIARRQTSHVVVDTDALSWALDPRPIPRSESARALIGSRTRVVAFVTVVELH